MDSPCVVCWECWRLSQRLTVGVWPDGSGSTFTVTAADVERWEALRGERVAR